PALGDPRAPGAQAGPPAAPHERRAGGLVRGRPGGPVAAAADPALDVGPAGPAALRGRAEAARPVDGGAERGRGRRADAGHARRPAADRTGPSGPKRSAIKPLGITNLLWIYPTRCRSGDGARTVRCDDKRLVVSSRRGDWGSRPGWLPRPGWRGVVGGHRRRASSGSSREA